MGKSCLIISGGDFSREGVSGRFDLVLACDRGYEYAARLGVAPDAAIGDFDSADAPDSAGIPIVRFPSVKDDTDTMLAAKYALERGCDDIAVCCAFGGRLDHALANIQTAAYIVAHGARACIFGADTAAEVFSGGARRFPRRDGWSLSVFALSDRCAGVSISGTKYEVRGAELTNGFPLGVSNTWASNAAAVSAESGTVLVLMSRLRPGEHI